MAIVKAEELNNCPICGKGCPMDEPGCGRGKKLSEKLAGGEGVDLDAFLEELKQSGENHQGKGDGHGHAHGHHRHGEGHHH